MQQICSSDIYGVHLGRGKPRSALTQLEDRHCGRTPGSSGVDLDSGPRSTGSTGRQGLTVDSKSTVDSGRQRSTADKHGCCQPWGRQVDSGRQEVDSGEVDSAVDRVDIAVDRVDRVDRGDSQGSISAALSPMLAYCMLNSSDLR